MHKIIIAIGLLTLATPALACKSPWAECWAGQAWQNNQCEGEIKLMSAYAAKQWLQDNPQWRLPTKEELAQHLLSSNADHLRQHAATVAVSAVLTAEVMQHGNELLAVSINIHDGKVELQPWRQPVLVLWRQSSW